MQKKLGVTTFVSEIKPVENHPDFEKLVHVIQHRLQGFVVKNSLFLVSTRNDNSSRGCVTKMEFPHFVRQFWKIQRGGGS